MRRDAILALVALLALAALGSEAEGIQAQLGVGKASCNNVAAPPSNQAGQYGPSVTDLVRFTCDLDDLLLQNAGYDAGPTPWAMRSHARR